MITIPSALQTDLNTGNFSLALLVTITRTDEVVERSTTSDQDETIDDLVYLSAKGLGLSDLENTASLAVNNADLTQFMDAGTRANIWAGVYDYAMVEVREFNRLAPAHGSYSRGLYWFGELSTERLTFKAELRSLVQALSRTIGFNCTALCPYTLGDARCRKDLNTLSEDGYQITVNSVLTGVGGDNSVMFDTERTEPGPVAGPAISGITNAKPGVVTVLTPITDPNGTAIVMYGITQPALLNTMTVIRDKAADGLSFKLGIDTSDTAVYPTYISSGHIASMAEDAGYFGYGLFKATSGLCAGRSMGVKAYRPGQIILQAPMPFQMAIGDAYQIVAGCNKLIKTCRDKFDNVAPIGGGGFGGKPYLGGQDKLVQVGRAG